MEPTVMVHLQQPQSTPGRRRAANLNKELLSVKFRVPQGSATPSPTLWQLCVARGSQPLSHSQQNPPGPCYSQWFSKGIRICILARCPQNTHERFSLRSSVRTLFFFCSTRASHCCGLSRCGAQAPDAQAQRPWLTSPAAPRHVGSSRTGA